MVEDHRVRYAGFWVRFSAEMIDSTVLTIVSTVLELMILGLVYWIRFFLLREQQDAGTGFFEAFNALLIQVLNVILYGLVAVPYYTYGHYRYGTTLGKKPFHVYVVDAHTHARITLKQSYLRCFGYFVSYIPFGTGYLMAAFHPEKRALHDLIAGTVSIYSKEGLRQ